MTVDAAYYVATTGSDSNSGASGSPWATLTHAYNTIRDSVDFAGKTVTVNVAAGQYAPLSAQGPCIGQVAPSSLRFVGNVANCWAHSINATGANAITLGNGARLHTEGFVCRASGPIPYGFGCVVGEGHLALGTMMWDQCVNGAIDTGHGTISILGAQGFWSGGNCAIVAEAGGMIFGIGKHFYLYNAPHFTGAYILCDQCALVDVSNAIYYQPDGPATGLKVNCSANGVVVTTGTSVPGVGVSVGQGGQIL